MPQTDTMPASVAEHRWERLRKCAVVLCFAIAAGLCVAYAYYTVFSRFQPYDDEGFILISLKWFFAGHALYDEVYSCYQPGFYVINWLIFSLWRAPLCHDSIRLLTVVFWIGGAGLNALITYRLTRSAVLSLLVLFLSTRCLDVFANEPGHPEALCYLLVAGLAALIAYSDLFPPRVMAVGAGALLSLLLLVKINIGCFAALALLLVVAAAHRAGRFVWLKGAVALLMVLVPAVLMHSRLDVKVSPAPGLYLVEGLAALLIGFVLFQKRWSLVAALILLLVCALILPLVDTRLLASQPFFSAWLLTLSICFAAMICLAVAPEPSDWQRAWVWAALGGASTLAIILLTVLLHGTSVHGLTQGMFVIPASLTRSVFVPWHSSRLGAWLALAGALSCLRYVRRRLAGERTDRPGALLTSAKLAFGLLVLFEFYVREPGSRPLMPLDYRLPHFWMLPFTWLAAASGNAPQNGLGRLGLVALAVMQPLIAYPVAGSQLVPASMLLAVVAAVCLGDAVAEIAPKLPVLYRRPVRIGAGSFLALLLVVFFARETRARAQNYAALTPLDLPGAKHVRLPADQVRAFQELVQPLARPEVETFLTLPGLNSLYFWAGKEPPTGLNTAWMTLLEASAQEKIWDAARERRGLMVIRNQALARSWMKGRLPEQVPLVRHIEENFQTVLTNGSYELMIRRSAVPPSP